MAIDVPVVFITFNRPDTTVEVFERIRYAAPRKLYLVSDGARAYKEGEKQKVQEIRAYLESHVDWDCTVEKVYAEQNLGCRDRINSALDYVFERDEAAIILEDDVCPDASFFEYCQVMLKHYKEDERIGIVTGCNLCPEYHCDKPYMFSRLVEIWGWATWRRVWQNNKKAYTPEELHTIRKSGFMRDYWGKVYGRFMLRGLYDVEVRKTQAAWSYHFCNSVAMNHQLNITPPVNLIHNIGFGRQDATNTVGEGSFEFTEGTMHFPIAMRSDCVEEFGYDRCYINKYYRENIIEKCYSFVMSHYLDWKKKRR